MPLRSELLITRASVRAPIVEPGSCCRAARRSGDEAFARAASAAPKFYAAAQVEALRHEVDTSRAEAETAKTEAAQAIERATTAATRSADDRVAAFRAAFPTTLEFPTGIPGCSAG